MTRILRIDFCDECPNLRHRYGEPFRCAAAKEDWNDHQISRRIRDSDPYPFIPAWCPLEQDGPDRQPPERVVIKPGSGPWPRPGQKPARRERGPSGEERP